MKTVKKKKSSKNIFIFAVLLGIIMVFFIKLYIMFKVDLLMKDLHSLEQRKNSLVSETEQLLSEVERLRNIDRISRLAEQQSGLVNNTEPLKVITLKDYDRLKHLKKEFAENDSGEDKTYQVAGVH